MVDLDAQLSAIAAGDPDAFGRWVAGGEPALRDALRSLAAHVDVEAVLQEALLRLWQVAPRCVPDGRPNALLRLGVRIARNLALDELRRTRSVAIDPEALERALADDATPEPRAPDPLLRRAIEECRQKLPHQPAAALAARIEAAGTEPDETLAMRLQMRLNTFLQNVGRARKLLAACLERRGVDLRELT
jgi:DNA-directed RNA polymerase specialized sigma24 family protein